MFTSRQSHARVIVLCITHDKHCTRSTNNSRILIATAVDVQIELPGMSSVDVCNVTRVTARDVKRVAQPNGNNAGNPITHQDLGSRTRCVDNAARLTRINKKLLSLRHKEKCGLVARVMTGCAAVLFEAIRKNQITRYAISEPTFATRHEQHASYANGM